MRSGKRTGRLTWAAAALLLIHLVWPASNSVAEKAQAATPAKEFSLKDVDSKKVSLSEFKGKVVLINFFATWCSPCRMEIPELVKMHKKFKNKDFVILGISLDQDVVPLMVKTFAKDMKITYPVLMGTMEIADGYQVSGVPATVVITRDGKIYKRFDGLVPTKYLEKAVTDLLEAKS
jgi:cytochrome c biogenesis protein CcmG, thiol:disulfide interchange protein DsbE